MTPKEIHGDMVQTLAEDTLLIQLWATEFKSDRNSTKDPYPKTSTTDEQIDTIHRMVLDDSHLTVQQIAKSIGISSGSVHTVLTEILEISKFSARLVPRMLTSEQKLKRVVISRTILTCFQADPEYSHFRLVTQDETWLHHFEPESKIQSK